MYICICRVYTVYMYMYILTSWAERILVADWMVVPPVWGRWCKDSAVFSREQTLLYQGNPLELSRLFRYFLHTCLRNRRNPFLLKAFKFSTSKLVTAFSINGEYCYSENNSRQSTAKRPKTLSARKNYFSRSTFERAERRETWNSSKWVTPFKQGAAVNESLKRGRFN